MTVDELSGYFRYSAKIKAINDEIEYLRGRGKPASNKVEELQRLKDLCENERAKISDYILAVPDPLVSGMMYARFVLGKSWYGVALYVGGNNTADSCRMAVFRYCDK